MFSLISLKICGNEAITPTAAIKPINNFGFLNIVENNPENIPFFFSVPSLLIFSVFSSISDNESVICNNLFEIKSLKPFCSCSFFFSSISCNSKPTLRDFDTFLSGESILLIGSTKNFSSLDFGTIASGSPPSPTTRTLGLSTTSPSAAAANLKVAILSSPPFISSIFNIT